MSEIKKITMDEFIKKFDKFNAKSAKENYVSTLINDRYIGYATKQVYAEQIVQSSSLNKDGVFHMDSCKKYLMFIFALFDCYTNLDVQSKNWTEQYDQLESRGAIDMFVNSIPEKEVKIFNTIVDMVQSDFITNHNNIFRYMDQEIIPYIQSSTASLLKSVDTALSSVNEDKFVKVLSMFMK